MRRILTLLVLSALFFSLFSCETNTEGSAGVKITDAFGNEAYIEKNDRIVSCYASFAECFMLAGGSLVGVTSDAIEEHGLKLNKDVLIVGTVKEISMEALAMAEPDYVILSADLAAHRKLEAELSAIGISYGYFRVDTFDDYKALMAQFCAVTERADLYAENVEKVETNIKAIMQKIPREDTGRVLLMRVYSTGIKAKTRDNLAGQIISEFGLINIADEHPSILEDMSLEHIVYDDPDYIIALTMGNADGAIKYLEEKLESNPAWSELGAIKSGNYHVLPKDLFHYKPNNRWDESYEYLAKIFYPEIFG